MSAKPLMKCGESAANRVNIIEESEGEEGGEGRREGEEMIPSVVSQWALFPLLRDLPPPLLVS